MTYTNTSGTIDEVLFCQSKFPIKLRIGEGSFKGVKMIWSLFNFKSPLGSLTEEYGISFPFLDLLRQLKNDARIFTIALNGNQCFVKKKENK